MISSTLVGFLISSVFGLSCCYVIVGYLYSCIDDNSLKRYS